MIIIVIIYAGFFYFLFRRSFLFYQLERNSEVTQYRKTFYDFTNQLFLEKLEFYRNLDQENKYYFIGRVHEFIKSKEWVGVHGFELKSEHRALIAGTAIQLTWGLNQYIMYNIERIFVSPEEFYSRLFEQNVKGLTTHLAVYLSWKEFELGIENKEDSFNLGLHEFAHALDILSKIDNRNLDLEYLHHLNNWQEISSKVFRKYNSFESKPFFMRDYSLVNKNEFFAVAIENFFERPKLFYVSEPKLFFNLCKLLNLNPLNKLGNYELEINELAIEMNLVGEKGTLMSNFYLASAALLGLLSLLIADFDYSILLKFAGIIGFISFTYSQYLLENKSTS